MRPLKLDNTWLKVQGSKLKSAQAIWRIGNGDIGTFHKGSGAGSNEPKGKWMMEKVYEYDNDVTEKHNPKHNRWFEFNVDGTFVSDGDPFGRNTGKWTMDYENSVLFIYSVMDDDDSEWKVVVDGDQMTWVGIGHPRKQNTRVVYKKGG